MYIHELPDWPRFHWNRELLGDRLAGLRHRQGRLAGHMEALGSSLRQEAVLRTLTADVVESTEIDGKALDADQVRFSIASRLRMDIGASEPADREVEGAVELVVDATRNYDQPLTEERLFDWHAALFPTGPGGWIRLRFGAWREGTGPTQVASGPSGQQ